MILGTFGRASVPQRLINQSLYQEILLLQKFNDIGGKVLKPKKIQPPTSKKKWGRFSFFHFFKLGFRPPFEVIWEKKFLFSPQKCKLELCMSNGSEVLIYLSFLLCRCWIWIGEYLLHDWRNMKYICLLYSLIIIRSRFSVNRHLEFWKKARRALFLVLDNDWKHNWENQNHWLLTLVLN